MTGCPGKRFGCSIHLVDQAASPNHAIPTVYFRLSLLSPFGGSRWLETLHSGEVTPNSLEGFCPVSIQRLRDIINSWGTITCFTHLKDGILWIGFHPGPEGSPPDGALGVSGLLNWQFVLVMTLTS